MFSPDGSGIYFTRNVSSGNTFIYAQDSNQSLFEIDRYDLETGERKTIASGPGGSVRPTPSPDGNSIAFVRRERGKSKLYVKDLRSGIERKIYDDLDLDLQETWAVYGVYPNMDWTPNSRSIVFWAGGKIRRINAQSGEASVIEFTVDDTREVVDPPRPQIDVAVDTFTTKMPRFAKMSPDGGQVVFESLGKLYVKNLPNGNARRLTSNAASREMFPSWSRNGRKIVYATWDDEELGAIHTINADGSGRRTITSEPGHYRRPRFSPDRSQVVFEKGAGGYLTSREWSENSGVYIVPANGGAMREVTKSGHTPHFGADNQRIFLTKGGEDTSLVSVNLSGDDERVHASGALITEFQVSPSGEHVAFRENYSAYVMPITPGPQKIGAGKDASAAPIVKASGDGALYTNWSHDGSQLNWSLGPTLFSASIREMIPALPAVADAEETEGYEPPETGASLAREVAADKPEGVVAITGARIITMADENGGIIDDGVIVIEGQSHRRCWRRR